ncbi:hypothetical protein GQ53DRAFT_745174 [Thozetella sp. PMI_491]|nr:hypothetical protein GQ53DRAFT_745174 [Thozetella sp. PMI_491]
MTTCATDEYAFPKIELSKPFASLHKIEAVLAKTTSSFNMGNSPYNLDVSVYRRWKANTLAQPAMGVGVEVYGDDWDMTMKETELAGRPRDWAEDLSEFFPDDYSSEMKHMDAFFSYVHGIQDWLEGIPWLRREEDEPN